MNMNNWQTKKLKYFLKVRHGKDQKLVEDKNGIYPILASGSEIGRTNSCLYSKPSVLIGKKGTIDKPQYIENPFWTIDTLFYTIIENNNKPKFFYYLFQTINLYKYNEDSTVPSLNSTTIESIVVKVPPLADQEKIVSILSKQDEVIEKLEDLIELKVKQKKGLMQRFIYTQKNTKSYKVKDLFELGRGRVISKNEIKKNKGIYPVYSSQTLDDGILGYINTYDFECKCITWTTDGANAGDVFYRNGRFNCTNVCGIAKAKDESMINLYYATCFLNHVTKKYVSYVGNPKLMNGVFAVIPLELPEINIQNKVASILSKCDEEIELLKKKLELNKKQKKWLMQKLLSGEIRVKEV